MNVIRIRAVIKATGLSRTTIWRLERRGDFPKRLRLGPNSTGWLEAEIQQWIESRPRGMSICVSDQEAKGN
jgi:prophage regulatory protein